MRSVPVPGCPTAHPIGYRMRLWRQLCVEGGGGGQHHLGSLRRALRLLAGPRRAQPGSGAARRCGICLLSLLSSLILGLGLFRVWYNVLPVCITYTRQGMVTCVGDACWLSICLVPRGTMFSLPPSLSVGQAIHHRVVPPKLLLVQTLGSPLLWEPRCVTVSPSTIPGPQGIAATGPS